MDAMISAEIVPNPGKKTIAAREMQGLGFRILLINDTITVQGRQSLWTSTFGVQFAQMKRPALSGVIDGNEIYQKGIKQTLKIPLKLQNLVKDVMFIEPPELF